MDKSEKVALDAVTQAISNYAKVAKLHSKGDDEIASAVEQALADAGLKNFEVIY